MKLSKVIAFLIWVAWVLAWVHAANTSPQYVPKAPPGILFLPAVMMAGPFLTRRDPFDVAPLRAWIDNRLGDGSYVGFIRNLTPMLLLSLSCIVSGLLGFARNLRANAPLGIADRVFESGFVNVGLELVFVHTDHQCHGGSLNDQSAPLGSCARLRTIRQVPRAHRRRRPPMHPWVR